MTRFDPKGKYTIQGRPLMSSVQMVRQLNEVQKERDVTIHDLFDILYTIPGMKEHDERFRRRAAALQFRLEQMNMNHEDAAQLAWLHTFHEFEDTPFKGEQ